MDSVRQFIATGLGTWEFRLEHVSTYLDRRNKTVGDAAISRMRNKRIDGSPPMRLRYAGGDALVGDDAHIALRNGDEDQDAGAILLARDAADGELLHGGAMGDGAARCARHQRHPDARQTKQHSSC